MDIEQQLTDFHLYISGRGIYGQSKEERELAAWKQVFVKKLKVTKGKQSRYLEGQGCRAGCGRLIVNGGSGCWRP